MITPLSYTEITEENIKEYKKAFFWVLLGKIVTVEI